MMTKTETAAEAAKLLRAVPEVAIDRDWITEKLMEGRDDLHYVLRRNLGGTARLVKFKPGGGFGADAPAACSDVTGCCAVGFIDLAVACANGFSAAADDYAKELLARALVELGWADPVFEAAYENMQDDEYPPSESYEEWRENMLSYGEWDNVGEEGLVPAWNDHHCTGKEEVLELVAKAAEIGDREAAA